jgi:hypothetical protein
MPKNETAGLQNLVSKIRRLYAAINSATELDYKKFPPKFFKRDDGSYHVRQDFNAGFTEEQLLNLAYQVIRSIADLKDHLRAAARQIGRDPQEVNDVVNSCPELAVIVDLAHADKHSGLEREPKQWSKRSPRLTGVKRVFQVTQKGRKPGSSFGMRLTSYGMEPFGDAKAAVVLSGDIVDGAAAPICELQFAQQTAVEAWEKLLNSWGISGRQR